MATLDARRGVFTLRIILLFGIILAFTAVSTTKAQAQTLEFHGEASIAGILSDAEEVDRQASARYLPELSLDIPLAAFVTLDFSVSANLWSFQVPESAGEDMSETGADPYRAWVRLSAPRFEIRAGLQKISFGSASIFRPLMWFDRIDPRDPLQLTEGVWGLLCRAYLPGNATAWVWILRGENKRKGWELIPTEDGTVEGGGRLQVPVGPGEAAVNYHRRRFDLSSVDGVPAVPFSGSGMEDRFAFDGKWDLELGVWVEGAFIRQKSEALERTWSRALSFGADYTFDIGNGLTVLSEYFYKENPSFAVLPSPGGDGGIEPRGSLSASADPFKPQIRLASLTASYSVGVLDQVALATYRDLDSSDWYNLLEWRRSYDRWRLHFLAFWNPEKSPLFPSSTPGNAASSGSLSGRGVQFILVFNH
jgi:hypothetical protein